MTIPLVDLHEQYRRIKQEIHRRIDTVLEHGHFILGPEVTELEERLAEFAGGARVTGVSNCSDALVLALLAWDIGKGDAVFLPSFTFTATAEAPLLLGATPVFVDVDPQTFNIDVADLARRYEQVKTEGRLHPKAVIAVDLFGQPADYRKLKAFTQQCGMHLLADAAQSFGAELGDQRVGRLAPVTVVSFFPAKPLGCYGDGGAIFTEDFDLDERFRSLRSHGKGHAKYDITRIGMNARLDTLQAAILLAKLDIFPAELEARRCIAAHYDERLRNHVSIPERVPQSQSAWAQYSILLDDRDRVATFLKNKGIATAVYYPLPMHQQSAYSSFANNFNELPISDTLCQRILSLPMNPYLEIEVVDRICDALIEIVSNK